MDLSDIRRDYTKGGLRREDLTQNPLDLFNIWLQQAIDAQLSDPTAMTVATVDSEGRPYQRIVLLKDVGDDGFVFYTNLGSRKALHLQDNANISLHFPWHALERQIHVTGTAEKLSSFEVVKYFSSRPKESQIAAWASKQSSRLGTRQLLESKYFELKKKFSEGDVPLPSFWGGYRVKISSIEFWQGGDHRLHDRFLYTKVDHENWSIERLAP